MYTIRTYILYCTSVPGMEILSLEVGAQFFRQAKKNPDFFSSLSKTRYFSLKNFAMFRKITENISIINEIHKNGQREPKNPGIL